LGFVLTSFWKFLKKNPPPQKKKKKKTRKLFPNENHKKNI
jgi:hypothetical protein